MTTRASTNFWLDVVSLTVMTGLAATGGLIHFVLPAGSGHFYALFGWNRHDIGELHFYLAVTAVVLLALHVLLHWNWICCVIAKMAGKNTPSRKSQTIWGVSLLLLIAVLLAGGLFWASVLVERTAPERGGRGRRAHLDAILPGAPIGLPTAAEPLKAPPARGEGALSAAPGWRLLPGRCSRSLIRRNKRTVCCSSQAALSSHHAVEAVAPTQETSPTAPPLEARPMTQRGDGRDIEESWRASRPHDRGAGFS